jgi:phage gpG-like protein
MKSLDEMSALIDGRNRDLMRYGRAIMKQETHRAFSAKVDPNTGRPWAPRQGSYPWPLFQHTGTAFGALNWGYGIKTKSGKLKFFGKVREGSYPGNYGGGKGPKPIHVVVGSMLFGRSKGRSSRGTKIFRTPSTGATPPRPFFGFSRSARGRFKRYAEKRLAQVFK